MTTNIYGRKTSQIFSRTTHINRHSAKPSLIVKLSRQVSHLPDTIINLEKHPQFSSQTDWEIGEWNREDRKRWLIHFLFQVSANLRHSNHFPSDLMSPSKTWAWLELWRDLVIGDCGCVCCLLSKEVNRPNKNWFVGPGHNINRVVVHLRVWVQD